MEEVASGNVLITFPAGSNMTASVVPVIVCRPRPGEVLAREELQKRLWPADVVVDFDRGLNKAINRVREALGDDVDRPRFIETLPQRGYRFLARVDGAPVVTVQSEPPPASSSLDANRERVSLPI